MDDNKVPILRPCPPTGAANEVLQLIGNKFCEDPPITVHPGQLLLGRALIKSAAKRQSNLTLVKNLSNHFFCKTTRLVVLANFLSVIE